VPLAKPGPTMRRRTRPGGEPARAFGFRWEQRRGVAVTSTGKNAEADVAYIGEGETLRQAGHRMRRLGVAALPVCREDGKLQGIITRNMVAESMAAGADPHTVTVAEVASTRWSLPSAVRQATPVSGARGRRDRRLAPVFGDYRAPREATWPGPLRRSTELHIGELTDAVRAAADALSRLSAVTTTP
jgi:hypothetical protein